MTNYDLFLRQCLPVPTSSCVNTDQMTSQTPVGPICAKLMVPIIRVRKTKIKETWSSKIRPLKRLMGYPTEN